MSDRLRNVFAASVGRVRFIVVFDAEMRQKKGIAMDIGQMYGHVSAIVNDSMYNVCNLCTTVYKTINRFL